MMLLAVLMLDRMVDVDDAVECIEEVDALREGPGDGTPRIDERKLTGEIRIVAA